MDTVSPSSNRRDIEDYEQLEADMTDEETSSVADVEPPPTEQRSLVPVADLDEATSHVLTENPAAYAGSLRGAATTSAPRVPGSNHHGQGSLVALSVIVALVTCIVVSAIAFVAINPPI